MKKLAVKENMHFKDVKGLVNDLLLKDETIMGNCLVENSGAIVARIGVGVCCGVGLTFNDYADQFKVVATNKRLLLIGLSHTVDLITGVRVIEYSEIKKLKMGKNLDIVSITLEDGKYFELTALDFSDNPAILEKARTTFNYISSNIVKENVAIKRTSLAMEFALLNIIFISLGLTAIMPRIMEVL